MDTYQALPLKDQAGGGADGAAPAAEPIYQELTLSPRGVGPGAADAASPFIRKRTNVGPARRPGAGGNAAGTPSLPSRVAGAPPRSPPRSPLHSPPASPKLGRGEQSSSPRLTDAKMRVGSGMNRPSALENRAVPLNRNLARANTGSTLTPPSMQRTASGTTVVSPRIAAAAAVVAAAVHSPPSSPGHSPRATSPRIPPRAATLKPGALAAGPIVGPTNRPASPGVSPRLGPRGANATSNTPCLPPRRMAPPSAGGASSPPLSPRTMQRRALPPRVSPRTSPRMSPSGSPRLGGGAAAAASGAATTVGGAASGSESGSGVAGQETGKCPTCGEQIPRPQLGMHANECFKRAREQRNPTDRPLPVRHDQMGAPHAPSPPRADTLARERSLSGPPPVSRSMLASSNDAHAQDAAVTAASNAPFYQHGGAGGAGGATMPLQTLASPEQCVQLMVSERTDWFVMEAWSRQQSCEWLNGKPPGTFVLRPSSKGDQYLALDFVRPDRQVGHSLLVCGASLTAPNAIFEAPVYRIEGRAPEYVSLRKLLAEQPGLRVNATFELFVKHDMCAPNGQQPRRALPPDPVTRMPRTSADEHSPVTQVSSAAPASPSPAREVRRAQHARLAARMRFGSEPATPTPGTPVASARFARTKTRDEIQVSAPELVSSRNAHEILTEFGLNPEGVHLHHPHV